MRNFLTFIFLLAFLQVKSQTPDWEWTKCAANGGGEGWSVATDATGNVFFSGGFYEYITFGSHTLTDPSIGYLHIFLVKYDASGNVMWALNSSGQSNANGLSIVTDALGNIYMTGYYSGGSITFGTHVLNNAGLEDAFVIKYDQAGNFVWATNLGGTLYERGYSISTNNSGELFITGFYTTPLLVFGSDTLPNPTDKNVFVAKLDTAGNIIWARGSLGTAANDRGFGVAADTSGNVFVTGEYASPAIIFGNDTLFNQGATDIFLVKYNLFGNIIWTKNLGGVNYDYGLSAATNSFGKIFITGFVDYSRMFIAQYDTNGNIDWISYSTGYARGYCVSSDAIGNAYVSGMMYGDSISFGTITLPLLAGDDPMFVAGFDSTGQATFAKGLSSGGDDQNSIAVDKDGNIFIGGDFDNNPFIVGNDTLTLTGFETPFVSKLRFSPAAGLSETDNEHKGIIFPNPFTNSVTVKTNDNGQSQIILYDILSRKLLQQTFSNIVTVNTEQLTSGIYIYEVLNKKGNIINGKLIKQ